MNVFTDVWLVSFRQYTKYYVITNAYVLRLLSVFDDEMRNTLINVTTKGDDARY